MRLIFAAILSGGTLSRWSSDFLTRVDENTQKSRQGIKENNATVVAQ
jgi:hypothetical protein